MSNKRKFRAVIESAGHSGAFITIPFDVEKHFGKKRVKVKAIIEGVPYRGTIMRMGGECHMLGILKEIREKIGKTVGDEITVTVEEDTEPREVEVPQDLRRALESDPEAEAFFKKLSYTHQKEYVLWIEEAKRDQTRKDRIDQTINLLNQGKKDH